MTIAADAQVSGVELALVLSDGRERTVPATLFDVGAAHGEGPAWLPGAGSLALVDMGAPVLMVLEPRTGVVDRIDLPEPGSAVVRLEESTVLVAAGRRLLLEDL